MNRVLVLIPVCSVPVGGILLFALVAAYPGVFDWTLMVALCAAVVAVVSFCVSFLAEGQARHTARSIAAWSGGGAVVLALGVVAIAVIVALVFLWGLMTAL